MPTMHDTEFAIPITRKKGLINEVVNGLKLKSRAVMYLQLQLYQLGYDVRDFGLGFMYSPSKIPAQE